ncbi:MULTISPECIES: glycosyltransferase [Gordonia]|uniref:Glycosyl transferase family 1 n=2 Tax=Gordonia alkanivorans TaxID=84096 RepID=W9D6M6_9ACTN|nr:MULTISPECIES: glycosyltransferase [Gordonia]ETA04828.1 glycosyl transferase family 1 [Gordonia alkanivorans CGMCC 6845]MDH3005642.1 glycosyltransferase [Gordonia alkanivorans]MDH3011024.1 glycosyltransferase [Gordonia alkanivorans]MDH3017576.1 glycosyltransferase [Gordonia alkanivorans]MDH3019944.1 glycosyltransferase [Gordonia alkanivorans]
MPRVAIAHDYLTQRGGAEKVVLSLSKAFPDAPIYTLLYEPDQTYEEFRDKTIITSPVNRVAALRTDHRSALPVLPFAASRMRIDADIVVVSSSGWAHGFDTSGYKLVYCYSPARWLYQTDVYLGESSSAVKKLAIRLLGPVLRRWDRAAARECDRYLAISRAVRDRIEAAYGLDSTVVSAPVLPPLAPSGLADAPAGIPVRPFHLCVSRLLAYKNVDAVIDAFRGTDDHLVVVGRGPEAERLRATKPENVTMLSDLTDAEMGWLYDNCTAVVAASYEDYGLTPLEGGMRGKPCAVLRWGGFLDTIAEGVNGVFFDAPDPVSIRAAVAEIATRDWDAEQIKAHVAHFGEETFIKEIKNLVSEAVVARGAERT